MVIPAATDYDWPVRKKRPEYIFLVKASSTGQLGVFGFGSFRLRRPGMPLPEVLADRLGLAVAVVGQAGTRRDQATDDHVFLQATEFVALTENCSLGQHSGRFLEGCGRDEGSW